VTHGCSRSLEPIREAEDSLVVVVVILGHRIGMVLLVCLGVRDNRRKGRRWCCYSHAKILLIIIVFIIILSLAFSLIQLIKDRAGINESENENKNNQPHHLTEVNYIQTIELIKWKEKREGKWVYIGSPHVLLT